MKVYIGADHRGFEKKEFLKKHLEGYQVEDMGAYEHNPDDDFTLFAEKVSSVVASDTTSRGILLCGSGVGVDVVANKQDGVRASIGLSKEQVAAGRADDDMNVLVIAADFTSAQKMREMAKMFLETKFSGKVRHTRRLQEIAQIEENN